MIRSRREAARIPTCLSVCLSMRLWTGACLGVALAACGGPSEPEELTGTLFNTAASGISYTTPTRTGVTDSNGNFKYLAGETVRFGIGAIELGAAAGAAQLDLFALSGVARPPATRAELYALISSTMAPQAAHLQSVTARARLVFSLDADADPSNGLQIDAATRDFFADRPVPLQPGNNTPGVGAFAADLRAWSRATGLGARPLMAPGLALALAYETAGVVPAVKTVTRQATDQGADGSIEFDTTTAFDGDGNRISQSRLAMDGSLIWRTDEHWGGNKNRLLLERDTDGDGGWDEIWRYEYNGDGAVTANSRTNAAGELLSAETNEFDDVGRRTRREWHSYESGSSGGGSWNYPEAGVTEAYNRSGALQTITYRNALGVIERVERIDDDDGSISTITTYDYDANWYFVGKRVTREGGALHSEERREYDDNGGLTLLYKDTNGDGVADSLDHRSYDERGYLVRRERDSNGDGLAEHRYEYDYDPAGWLIEYRRYDEGDLSYVVSSTYDADGARVAEAVDGDGDGTIDRRTTYVNDADGYQIEAHVDDDVDGLVDSISYWTWSPSSISAWTL